MVSTAAIISIIVNIVICFGIPVGGIIYLILAKKRAMKAVFVGAGVFFLFQIVIRIPIITTVFPPMAWYQQMIKNLWVYAIFLGLTAGLFEEVGRFIGYKTLLKDRIRWIDGVAFGIGHGGIEAILLVGLANISNLVMSLSINSGTFEKLMAAAPKETADTLYAQLTTIPATTFLMGGMERIFAIGIQIALSILVLYAVKERKIVYLFLAIALHMVIDAPAVILPYVYGFNIYQIEAVIAVVFIMSLAFIIWSKKRMFADEGDTNAPTPENPGEAI